MPGAGYIIDIAQLFRQQFKSEPYIVPGESITTIQTNDYRVEGSFEQNGSVYTKNGSLLKESYRGIEVMLPIKFFDVDFGTLISYLPFCVISVDSSKKIVETDLAERLGTVKELYSTGDYVFNVKGFLISADRRFPEAEIDNLRELYEQNRSVKIDNALSNIFLTNKLLPVDEQRRVSIYNFQMQEVQGGREHVRPFSMMLKSDFVFELELE